MNGFTKTVRICGTHWVLFGYQRGEIVPKVKEKQDKFKI